MFDNTTVCLADQVWTTGESLGRRAILQHLAMTCYNPIMHCLSLHPWDVGTREAMEIQKSLASRVCGEDGLEGPPRYVAGVDISPPNAQGIAVGAAVLLELPELKLVEVKVCLGKPGFPYVPGLLSFRESPLILGALERLMTTPDLILVDGQGLAHPRRFGLACHLGLLADVPTIGCAKSILTGRPEGTLAPHTGSRVPLIDRGDVVGAVVRTRDCVGPIYVSIGHKISLNSAVALTLACCKGYRIPEPTRLAHLAAAGRISPRVSENQMSLQHASRDAAVPDKDGVK